MILDEAICSLSCQHPPCWSAQRRITQGIPKWKTSESIKREKIKETGFPYQNVINLSLESFTNHFTSFHSPSDSFIGNKSSPYSSFASEFHSPKHEQISVKPSAPNVSPLSISLPRFDDTLCKRKTPEVKIKNIQAQKVLDSTNSSIDLPNSTSSGRYYVWVEASKLQNIKKKMKKQSKDEQQIKTSILPGDELKIDREKSYHDSIRTSSKILRSAPSLYYRLCCSSTNNRLSTQQENKIRADGISKMDNVMKYGKIPIHEDSREQPISLLTAQNSYFENCGTSEAHLEKIISDYHAKKDAESLQEFNKCRREKSFKKFDYTNSSNIVSLSQNLPNNLVEIKEPKPFKYEKNSNFDFSLGPKCIERNYSCRSDLDCFSKEKKEFFYNEISNDETIQKNPEV